MRGKMTRVLLICFMMAALAGCGKQEAASGKDAQQPDMEQAVYREVLEGDSAPDFTVELADGSTFVLSEQSGRVVLLNFWATWCGPCVREMPAFEKLYSDYGDEVAILAIDCAEDKETVDRFLSDAGYTFPIAYDVEGTTFMKYPSEGIPYTLVIGRDGIVRDIYMGAGNVDEQYEEYKSAIEDALGENVE
ncbi:MAG: TlpA family protein disulfide reductase [Clostridium sp.]|nr:TlpA family protein disulfide reductase [Clostridium sp.]